MNTHLQGSSRAVQRVLLSALLFLCYLPFLDKAFHIDDPLFIWTAQHIQTSPLDFFGFSVNWYGFDQPVSEITKNPPFYSYFLAAFAQVAGWSEQALHLASLLPLLALALGTYQLSVQLRADPLPATLLTICAPVFLLSGTTVMCDVTMTAFWVWGVYFWLFGLTAKGRSAALCAAAACIVLAGLTKYFGMALLPLLALYAVCKRTPLREWLPFIFLPLALYALYQWGSAQAYGTGLISEAARYSVQVRQHSFRAMLESLLVGLSFAGGSLLTPLFVAPLLLKARGWLTAGFCLALLCALLFMAGTLAGANLVDNWPLLLQAAVFILSGGGLLAIALADLLKERNAESLLLGLWVIGTFIFAALLNWTVSGRNMLPLAPAAGILLSRRLAFSGVLKKSGTYSKLTWLLLPLLGLSLLAAAADYRWAGEQKRAAELAAALKPPASELWFQGHWGFQYYMQKLGGKPLDFRRSVPAGGDLIVSPSFGTNIRSLADSQLYLLHTIETEPLNGLATVNAGQGTFFYSSKGGPLPFSFSKVAPDRYRVEQYRPNRLFNHDMQR